MPQLSPQLINRQMTATQAAELYKQTLRVGHFDDSGADQPLFCHHRARARFAGDSCDRDRLGQRPGSIPGHQGPSRRDLSVPGHRTTVSTCGDHANLTVERRSPGRDPGARRPPDRSERYDIELVRGRSKDELGEESVH
jgi:hypothetical protein